MTLLASSVIGFSLLANILLVVLLTRERSLRKQRSYAGNWPIQPVLPEELDPVFKATPFFGPGLATEIAFVGRGPYVIEGGTSDSEAWILGVLAKRAERLFEFGTCTGKTAYLWARNSPPNA